MDLKFDHHSIGEVECRHITLQGLLGSFALNVCLRINQKPRQGYAHRVSRMFALLDIVPQGENPQAFCRLEALPGNPIRIEDYPFAGDHLFRAQLSAHQLAALEGIRNGQDLTVRLAFYYTSEQTGNSNDEHHCEHLFHTVPLSQWVDSLNASGFQKVVLFEVNSAQMPSRAWEIIRKAQALFTRGLYGETIAECRRVMEVLNQSSDLRSLRDKARDAHKNTPKKMTQAERFAFVHEAIHHALHPAHHEEPSHAEDSAPPYSRDDAEFCLRLVTSCASFSLP